MLDVHPPHHKLHGLRDFFLHLFTITIGLLIALGLEAAAEHHNHLHLARESQSNLRQEIQDNRTDLVSSREAMSRERKDLLAALSFAQDRIANKPATLNQLTLAIDYSPLSDASWSTASVTGALNYMPYRTVQSYSAVYQLQQEYGQIQRDTLNDYLRLQTHFRTSADPRTMPPDEARATASDIKSTFAHLEALNDFSAGLLKSYDDALNHP